MNRNFLQIIKYFISNIKLIFNITNSKDIIHIPDRIEPVISGSAFVFSEDYNNYYSNIDNEIEFSIDIIFDLPVFGVDIKKILPVNYEENIRYLVESIDKRKQLDIYDNHSYSLLRILVLLADREGPISKSRFFNSYKLAKDITSHIKATIVCPDYDFIIDKAIYLDKLCMSLDACISLSLIMNKKLDNGVLLGIADIFSFVSHYKDALLLDNNECYIILSRNDNCSLEDSVNIGDVISLTLDIPRSNPNKNLFSIFFSFITEIAEYIDARVVDKNGLILSFDDISSIELQVQKILNSLENNGFKAGSYRARRVFK
ncbi:MAG: hypothetical protein I1N47_02495 [Candidatus Kinetoplastibacterium crithidii]|nr:MAG: hypothetical protein I1N47_02495 [Candidatus Kinetoplastibacterium crithidii]